jgi:hypothetical protein
MTSAREPGTTKGESRPSACPACGYDMAGVMHATCPECGADVAKERARLGPRKSVLWVIAPLSAGSLVWTCIGQAPFALASQYPFDPFRSSTAWFVWGVMATHLAALAVSLALVRKISRAEHSTHSKLTLASWLLLTVPFVLLLFVMRA